MKPDRDLRKTGFTQRVQKTAERRGLGAELARKLGGERAQVSRFKAGKEAFPASKLVRLSELLTASRLLKNAS